MRVLLSSMLTVGVLLSTIADSFAQKKPARAVGKYNKNFHGIGPSVYVLPPPRTQEEVLIAQYVQKRKEQSALEPLLDNLDLREQLITIEDSMLPADIDDSIATLDLDKEERLLAIIHYYHRQNKRVAVANWQNNLAVHYLVSGKVDRAKELFSSALGTQEEIGTLSTQLAIINNLALLAIKQEDYKGALRYYDRVLDQAKEVNDIDHQALAYMAMARMESKLGNFSTAHALTVEKSFPLLRKAKNYPEVVNALLDLASFKEMANKPIEAKWIYLQAIDVATIHQDERGLAKSLFRVAELKNRIGDTGLAIADYSRARELAIKNGMDALLIKVINGMGDAYMQLNNYVAATFALNEYNTLRKDFLSQDFIEKQ